MSGQIECFLFINIRENNSFKKMCSDARIHVELHSWLTNKVELFSLKVICRRAATNVGNIVGSGHVQHFDLDITADVSASLQLFVCISAPETGDRSDLHCVAGWDFLNISNLGVPSLKTRSTAPASAAESLPAGPCIAASSLRGGARQ